MFSAWTARARRADSGRSGQVGGGGAAPSPASSLARQRARRNIAVKTMHCGQLTDQRGHRQHRDRNRQLDQERLHARRTQSRISGLYTRLERGMAQRGAGIRAASTLFRPSTLQM